MRYRLKDDGNWWDVETCWGLGIFWCYRFTIYKLSGFASVPAAVKEARRRLTEERRSKRKLTVEFNLEDDYDRSSII